MHFRIILILKIIARPKSELVLSKMENDLSEGAVLDRPDVPPGNETPS